MYKILETLRKSENADIFLVLNDADNRVCVMKKIKNGSVEQYNALMGLNNGNLVKIYDVIEHDNTVILEYISGKPLSEINHEVRECEVLDWTLQICDAVSELHRNGIIHRDIKPSNIMLTDDNVIKIIDFDISRTYKQYRRNDTRNMGTDGFAPPEQYGFAQTDFRTDIYAIGAVMYELVSGGKPIDTLHTYRGILKTVIEKCVKLDPKDRFQSIAELKNALVPSERVQAEPNRKRNSVSVVMVAAVVLLAGIILQTILHFANENKSDEAVFVYAENKTTQDKKEFSIDAITLEAPSFNEKSVPVGVSSLRLAEENTYSKYLIVYLKISDNSGKNNPYKVRLYFDVYDENGEVIGVEKRDFTVNPSEEKLVQYTVTADFTENGYECNGGIVRKIRLTKIDEI